METKNIQNIIKDNSLRYGKYIITNRALPDLRDGLKPVHRRILYTMNLMKATNFTKSQNIEGNVMRFHPHGGSYGSMVGMVQTDNNLTPLLIGKGNFAQHTSRDLQPGAQRYTECKLSDISKDMLQDLNKKMVEFIPNFDGTEMIPEVLPTKFPSVLHYAQEGIAYGMSSRTPSFNLIELNEAIIKKIETGEETLLIPDFATGGSIINQEEVFKKINFEGTGTIRLRAKATINNNIISITEIPYSTTRENIIEKIIELVKSGKLKEITNISDLTGLNRMEIEITCKKNSDMEVVLEKLYKYTSMESTYSCNMNVLNNGLPMVMGVWQIIDEWLEWRRNCIKRKISYEIELGEKELHILKGLEKILNNIDDVINIMRNEDEMNLKERLCLEFNLDENQAEQILNMKFKNINKNYIAKKIKDIQELENLLSNKKENLKNKSMINYMIINDLKFINSTYGKERLTEILTINKTNTIKEKIKIEKIQSAKNTEVRLIVTEQGYIKKLKSNDILNQRIKEDDKILYDIITTEAAEVLIFIGTDVYKIYVNDLKLCKSNEFGEYYKNIIGINDELTAISIVDDEYKFLINFYDNGKIAKVDINAFKTKTKRRKLENSLSKLFNLKKMITLKEDTDLLLTDYKGKTKIINTKNIPLKVSRGTQGITVWRKTTDIEVHNQINLLK